MRPQNLKHLTLLALFTTLALAIYSVESLLPALVPIPGVKLGLANIITLLVLKNLSAKEAFGVLVTRIFLSTFLFGHMMSLFYSLAGGILCFLIMWAVHHFLGGRFLILTSMFGALFHNIGQMLVAILLTASLAPLSYLPFFILSTTITGFFTGLCAYYAQKHLGSFLRHQLL